MSVYETIIVALVLVVLVIFFFLREVRATLIPAVTIPVSLIGHFTFLKALGFSINTLTLARRRAGDRSGGGRRHRGAGEHPPPHRGGHEAAQGGVRSAARKSASPSSR